MMVEGSFGEGNLPFLLGSIAFPSLHEQVATQHIVFLVDTGCSVSMIAPGDVRDLGLLPHLAGRVPEHTTSVGCGGYVDALSYLLDAVVILDGLTLAFGEGPLGQIDVRPPLGNPGELEVPSLLGWDVFQHLLLAFDYPAGHFRLYTHDEASGLLPQPP
jgi:hypothetical protein